MSKQFFKSVVVAINGSQSSIHAAMYSIMLAKSYNLLVKAVFVVDVETLKFLTMAKFFAPEERDSYMEALRKDGKTYLDYIQKLAKSKGVQIELVMKEGSVWAEIINTADECKADLILVGGHEEKRSIAKDIEAQKSVVATSRTKIVNYAHCPVLVVHKPEIESLFKIS